MLAVAEATQTPLDMAAVKTLAVIAICVQGKFKVQGKPDYTEPQNIFAVVILPPAERKSAVDSIINRPIELYERTKNENNKIAIERSKAKKNALKKAVDVAESKYAKGIFSDQELFSAQDAYTNF